MKILSFLLTLSLLCSCSLRGEKDKKVFLAFLVRNKAHYLPRFLQTVENFEYDKKQITVYINTNNNSDESLEILKNWADSNKKRYRSIIFENHEIKEYEESPPHVWSFKRLRTIGKIRERSLEIARQSDCDFYFVIDVDNFLSPHCLKALVEKNVPIVAPMLYSIPDRNDYGSTFFYAINDWGGFQEHPQYWDILNREIIGTFKVPLVHATYLIKKEYLDRVTYVDGTDQMEFMIFAQSARKNGVDQYICNEEDFGVQFSFHNRLMSLQDEKHVTKAFLTIP